MLNEHIFAKMATGLKKIRVFKAKPKKIFRKKKLWKYCLGSPDTDMKIRKSPHTGGKCLKLQTQCQKYKTTS